MDGSLSGLHGANFMFSSHLSSSKTCPHHPTPPLLTPVILTANTSIMYSQPPSLANNTISSMPLFSNNPLSSLSWRDSHHMRTMSLSRVSSMSSITFAPHRSTWELSSHIPTISSLQLSISWLLSMTPWTFSMTKVSTTTFFLSH